MKKLLLLTILAFSFIGCDYVNEQKIVATVEDKDRIHTKEESYYLIYTDNGTFKITDQFFYWKFNSSDIYGSLTKGQQYELTVHGFRVPFLSWYQNIETATQISKTK